MAPLPGETEALDIRPDGLLIGGTDGSTKLFTYDASAKKMVSSSAFSVAPYSDVESIAWPECLSTGAKPTAAITTAPVVGIEVDTSYALAEQRGAARKLQPYGHG